MKAQVYGRENCPYCVKAKDLLEQKEIDFEYIDIVTTGIGKDGLSKLCGKEISTVPQIFLDGELIGGYSELLAKLTEENSISFDIEL